jgi:hypothetical protein
MYQICKLVLKNVTQNMILVFLYNLGYSSLPCRQLFLAPEKTCKQAKTLVVRLMPMTPKTVTHNKCKSRMSTDYHLKFYSATKFTKVIRRRCCLSEKIVLIKQIVRIKKNMVREIHIFKKYVQLATVFIFILIFTCSSSFIYAKIYPKYKYL